MTEQQPPRDDADESRDDDAQVSEVTNFDRADEPISPDQAVAGYPESESGEPDEGPAGPDAVTGSPGERPDR